jgi:hypothetical protein
MTRHVGLALSEQLRELPDRELLLCREGEEAKANRLGEEPVELPPLRRLRGDGYRGGVGVEHEEYIFMNVNERN